MRKWLQQKKLSLGHRNEKKEKEAMENKEIPLEKMEDQLETIYKKILSKAEFLISL